MKTTFQKRLEAEARQAAHDALDAEQKLAKAHTRRGESRRERARIEAQL